MAYAICYLIKMPGAEFNLLQKPNHQVSETYLAEMARKQDLWDGMLPDDDMAFLVDLTGDWTLCTLPYKYTIFIGECTRLPMYARVQKLGTKATKTTAFL